jgi:hypothetical protein
LFPEREKRRARAGEDLALAFSLADRDPLWARNPGARTEGGEGNSLRDSIWPPMGLSFPGLGPSGKR